MAMTAKQKITRARANLLIEAPFFASLAMRLRVIEDNLAKTAWTDGICLGYNPAFIDGLTLVETVGLVAHEVVHVAHGHHLRRGKRDGSTWNVAADYVTNLILYKAGFFLPKKLLLDYSLEGKSAEEIYWLLTKDQQVHPQKGQPGNQATSPTNKPSPQKSSNNGQSPSQDSHQGLSQQKVTSSQQGQQAQAGGQNQGSQAQHQGQSPQASGQGQGAPQGQGQQSPQPGPGGQASGPGQQGPTGGQGQGAPQGQGQQSPQPASGGQAAGPGQQSLAGGQGQQGGPQSGGSSQDPAEGEQCTAPDGDPSNWGEVRDYGSSKGLTPSTTDLAAQEALLRVALAQAIQQAKSWGKDPGQISRIFKEKLKSRLDWRGILRRFVQQSSKGDYSWSRPNRRFISQGLYLPSLHHDDLDQVAIIVDTSASLSEPELEAFATELSEILSNFPGVNIMVVYCDSDVKNHQELTSYDLPLKLKALGGGGTDFRPGFRWLEKKGLRPDCLLYFTDGLCYDYPPNPGYPVLWIGTRDFTPPFGEFTRLHLG